MTRWKGSVRGLLLLVLLLSPLCFATEDDAKKSSSSSSPEKRNADFGGDFSAGSMSGAAQPGPTAGSMGNKAASAMAIGTGGQGTGDYASNYKTPNYTQYTNQDFKGKRNDGTGNRMNSKAFDAS